MEDGFEDALRLSTLAIGPSGAYGKGVNKWAECSTVGDFCGSDPVADTGAPSLCGTNKKRKLLDLQLTSSQISDETCDAAAAVVMTLSGIAGNSQHSPKVQRCVAAPDTPPTPGRVLPDRVPPFAPDAACVAAAAAEARSLIAEVVSPSPQCTGSADATAVPALQAVNTHAAAVVEAEQPADDVQQQQQQSNAAGEVAPQEPLLPQEQEHELLFSPPASPASAPAALNNEAASAAATANNSGAASPVLNHTAANLQQQPHLQSLLLVASQLAATGAADKGSGMAAAGVRQEVSGCPFLPATQATLHATTAKVVAAEALAAALAAARINQTGCSLLQQQQCTPAAAGAQGQHCQMRETVNPQQQQQLLLPDWLCSNSANLAASAAVVRSSLLNATAALARLQQQQHPCPGHPPTSAAAAAMQPPAAPLGLLSQQLQQHHLHSVVALGVPVLGARVWGYPVYPDGPAAAAARPCVDPAAAGAVEYLDCEQQQFDLEMDDAVSCSSTPQSAAGGRQQPPLWAGTAGGRHQQPSSDSREVNDWDPECDDSASSKCSEDSSSIATSSSCSDDEEDSDDVDDDDAAGDDDTAAAVVATTPVARVHQ